MYLGIMLDSNTLWPSGATGAGADGKASNRAANGVATQHDSLYFDTLWKHAGHTVLSITMIASHPIA